MNLIDRIHKDYVYIIRTREAIRANENVYKVGMTINTLKKRMADYGFYESILTFAVNDAPKVEKNLLEILPSRYEINKEYGKEYFNVENINNFMNDFIDIVRGNMLSKGGDGTTPDYNINIKLAQDEIIDYKDKIPFNLISQTIGNNCNPINISITNIVPIKEETIPIPTNNEVKEEPINLGNHVCKRCGTSFNYAYLLERHFNRKKICKPVISSLPIEDLKTNLLNNKKIYKCKYCNKKYTSSDSKYKHQRKCKNK